MDEIITSHGYDDNSIMIWQYPSFLRLANLKGHRDRVLHMTLSRDGSTLCTGGPDEKLRFWDILTKEKRKVGV